MKGDRQQRLRTLFEQATYLPRRERPAYVAWACGSDFALRSQLKALLDAYDQAEGLADDLAETFFREEILDDNRVGSRILHYRIEDRLGGGGMGVVYRAFDEHLQRRVALKFLPPHLTASTEARQRLIQEARAASALDHPNIGTIHDVAETPEGQHFIAMTFYEGETLKHHIDNGPLPIDEAVSLALQIARGLRAAHRGGVIHRDVKPANVMLTREDLAKIVDFGLAKSEGLTITRTGTTLGTVDYMSPEQARGERVDARTDLWSLGVVLFEMLAATRPFSAPYDQALIYQILEEEPADLSALRPDVPDKLTGIVHKLLSKDPAGRYQSADDVIVDLESLRSPSAPAAAVPGVRRNRVVRASILTIAALLVIASGLHFFGLTPWSGAASESGVPMLAVLPFQNLGAESDDYFAAGITEEITSRLASVKALGVISSTSAMQYPASDKSTREIGAELGVDYLVTGTIQWDRSEGSNRIRVIPKLIQISDDRQLWSDRYDREMTDIFAVQSDLARAVIAELDVSLTGAERASVELRPTENLDAYQAYLTGLQYHRTYDTRDAIAMFERAIELDRYFLLPYIYLTRERSHLYALDGNQEHLEKAAAALARADSMASDHPQVALARGWYAVHTNAYREAFGHFMRATEGLPNDPNPLYGAAQVILHAQDFDEALRLLDRAIALNPRSLRMVQSRCFFNMLRRHYTEAEVDCTAAMGVGPDENEPYNYRVFTHLLQGDLKGARAVLPLIPSPYEDPWFLIETALAERRYTDVLATLDSVDIPWIGAGTYLFPPSYFRGFALDRLGREAEALASYEETRMIVEKLVADQPDIGQHLATLGVVYAELGMKDEAVRTALRGVDLDHRKGNIYHGSLQPLKLAYVYTVTGELQKAVELLDEQLSEPGWISVPWIRLNPRWDPLRDDPQFQAMIARHEESVRR